MLFFTSLAVLLGFSYLFKIHRQSAARKKKVVQYLFVLFALISLFTRAGASVFNAFAYPFSRHSFLFMPLVALMCAFSLDQLWLKRICCKTALVLSTVLILAAHLLALRETTEVLLKRNAIWLLLLSLSMAAVLFAGYKKHGKKTRRMMVSCLLLLCASSLILEGYACYNDRDTLRVSDASYWGGLYDPDVAEALDYLKTTDTSLYRVEKDYCSGSYCMDHARSVELCTYALNFARQVLKPKGNLVMKIFEGDMMKGFLNDVRSSFQNVKLHSPKASRDSSSEIYIIAKGFIPPKEPVPEEEQ